MKNPRCKEVITESWQSTYPIVNGKGLTTVMRKFRKKLEKWSKRQYGNNARKLAELKEMLKTRTGPHMSRSDVEEERRLKAQI